MMQFYLLSVFCNLVGGYALYSVNKPDAGNAFDGVKAFMRHETFRLVLGLAGCVVGCFKLLTVTDGDIPVIGDFSAAIIGLLVGFALVFEFYRKHSTVESKRADSIDRILLANSHAVGTAGMAAAAVHFLFPRVLFL
jgi:hypothetical protein